MKKTDIKLGQYLTRRGKKGILVFRFWHENTEYLRSTGTDLADVARDRAWAIYNDIVNPQAGQTPQPLLRNTHATAGQVADLYLAGICQRATISPKSAAHNVAKLARLITETEGFAGKQEWRDVRVNQLDEDFVNRWRALRYAAKGHAGPARADLWLNGTLNSTLAQARSLFSRDAWKLYEKLKMPPRDQLLYAPRLAEPDYTFEEIPAHVDARMQYLARAALDGKPEAESPSQAVAVIFELARFYGLTGYEMLHARWDWMEEQPDGSLVLAIKARPARDGIPAFTTKRNAKNRRLGLNRSQVERWKRAPLSPLCAAKAAKKNRQPDAGGYIIPGLNRADRERTLQREASQWVRKFLPNQTKTLHALRAQGGSEVLKKYDLNTAADWLGDRIETAKKFYLARQVVAALGA
ncbi:MAG TPA: hypothetical protein VHC95_06905 [Opitutales bacterium]|nr:hypothetical protein [Opitutales bacterium]